MRKECAEYGLSRSFGGVVSRMELCKLVNNMLRCAAFSALDTRHKSGFQPRMKAMTRAAFYSRSALRAASFFNTRRRIVLRAIMWTNKTRFGLPGVVK